jgi:hypothetical protein
MTLQEMPDILYDCFVSRCFGSRGSLIRHRRTFPDSSQAKTSFSLAASSSSANAPCTIQLTTKVLVDLPRAAIRPLQTTGTSPFEDSVSKGVTGPASSPIVAQRITPLQELAHVGLIYTARTTTIQYSKFRSSPLLAFLKFSVLPFRTFAIYPRRKYPMERTLLHVLGCPQCPRRRPQGRRSLAYRVGG